MCVFVCSIVFMCGCSMGDVIEKMEKIVNENVSAEMSQWFSENDLGILVGNGYFGDSCHF